MAQSNPALAVQAATERCPWCSSAIPRTRFVQIQTRIAEEERSKLAAFQQDTEQRIAAMVRERDQATARLRQARRAARENPKASHRRGDCQGQARS